MLFILSQTRSYTGWISTP